MFCIYVFFFFLTLDVYMFSFVNNDIWYIFSLHVIKTWWQDEWPTSLKEFILKLRSMVFCQDQADMNMVCNLFLVTHLYHGKIWARSCWLKFKYLMKGLTHSIWLFCILLIYYHRNRIHWLQIGALYVAMHIIHLSCAACIMRVSIGLFYTEFSHALSIWANENLVTSCWKMKWINMPR